VYYSTTVSPWEKKIVFLRGYLGKYGQNRNLIHDQSLLVRQISGYKTWGETPHTGPALTFVLAVRFPETFLLESSTLELFIFGKIFSTAAFVGLVREANPNPRFCHF
jgi:hypothetical protein